MLFVATGVHSSANDEQSEQRDIETGVGQVHLQCRIGASDIDVIAMSNPLNLDLRARAELLTYLVVSHLLARQMTGEWLSVEHLVESTTLWLKTNGGGADVMQRVMLSTRALDIARCLEQTLGPAVAPGSVTALFCESAPRFPFAGRQRYLPALPHTPGRLWLLPNPLTASLSSDKRTMSAAHDGPSAKTSRSS